jgi:hypothetical protein
MDSSKLSKNARKRPLEDSTNLKKPDDDFTRKKLKIHETPPPGIIKKWK